MVYKWYILPIGGLYATYHLLREPKTTIESMDSCLVVILLCVMVSDRISMGLVDLKNEVPKCDRNQVGPETSYKWGEMGPL